jgi:hypothetical protein
MAISSLINDIHLLHHHLMGQILIPLLNSRVMQRDKSESISATIQTFQSFDLRFAKVAVSIVDHDIRVGKIVGISQFSLLNH